MNASRRGNILSNLERTTRRKMVRQIRRCRLAEILFSLPFIHIGESPFLQIIDDSRGRREFSSVDRAQRTGPPDRPFWSFRGSASWQFDTGRGSLLECATVSES